MAQAYESLTVDIPRKIYYDLIEGQGAVGIDVKISETIKSISSRQRRALNPSVVEVQALPHSVAEVQALHPSVVEVQALPHSVAEVQALPHSVVEVQALPHSVVEVQALHPSVGGVQALHPSVGGVQALHHSGPKRGKETALRFSPLASQALQDKKHHRAADGGHEQNSIM
jgi:hypothetical protein